MDEADFKILLAKVKDLTRDQLEKLEASIVVHKLKLETEQNFPHFSVEKLKWPTKNSKK